MQSHGWAPPRAAPFEFGHHENHAFADMATQARRFGWASLVAGMLLLAAASLWMVLLATVGEAWGVSVLVAASLFPHALASLGIAGFYLRAGARFSSIVETGGQDVPHLIEALTSLQRAFQVEIVLSAIGFLGMIVLFVVQVAS